MELCQSIARTRLVMRSLLEMESEKGWQDEKVVYHLVLHISLVLPTGNCFHFFCFFNIFWARNCFFCSRVVSLPRYSHQKLLTHSVSRRRRNLPQQPALANTNTNNSKTDAQTCAPVWLKYVYTRSHKHTRASALCEAK